MEFCVIAPTAYLECFARGRACHLVLAQWCVEDPGYLEWYHTARRESRLLRIILDNGAYEHAAIDAATLVDVADVLEADVLVLPDCVGSLRTSIERERAFLAKGLKPRTAQ